MMRLKKEMLKSERCRSNYIAKEIAISAIRYYFVRQDIGKMIAFDIHDSLSLEGDTGPYIQYSYARGKRIYNKLENKTSHLNENDVGTLENLSMKMKLNLIKHFCRFSTFNKRFYK